MDQQELFEIFERLNARLLRQRRECSNIDSWLRPKLATGFDIPSKATREHRALANLSRTPWLRLVVDNIVQAMYVDNVVNDSGRIDSLWELWNSNSMRAQQISNHRAFTAYGHSYAVVSRAKLFREATARICCLSPKRIAVEYADLTYGADLPSAALEVISSDSKFSTFALHVPGVRYVIRNDYVDRSHGKFAGLRVLEEQSTGLGYVPVIRFANQLDLDGRVIGEVEPFIPAAQRINKTAYDRLLAQHFNSWKVKTATGLELPAELDSDGDPIDGSVDVAAAERMKIKLSQEDILIADNPDVRFGTLDATALDPFVNSWRADIEALAAASQTPAHALTGQLVNLSPEALAAARAPLTQKVYERQMNAGEAYAQTLRVAADIAGDSALARDYLVRVTWQDMEIRSLSQAADALGKIAQMLKVPYRALWSLIPGVEATDLGMWEAMAEEEAERDPLNAAFKRQAESTIEGVSGGEHSQR